MAKRKDLKKAYSLAQDAYKNADRVTTEAFSEYSALEDAMKEAKARYEAANDVSYDAFLVVETLEGILYP